MGLRHAKESLPTLNGSSWSTLPTRPASTSTASISLEIESDFEFNESSPLLESRIRNGGIHYYGLENHQEIQRRDQRESRFLSLNNHERCWISHELRRNRRFSPSPMSLCSSSSSSVEKVKNREVESNICTLRLYGMMFIFTSALLIATYLLIVESRLPTPSFKLELVHHDVWSKRELPLGGFLNQTDFSGVLVLHTGGSRCDNLIECIGILNRMQQASNQTELPYNFLVADDGQTYEIRGWEHVVESMALPDSTQSASLVIGFIGNYTQLSPTSVLLQSALSLMKESVRRRKLSEKYRIYGVRNRSGDGEALSRSIAKWPHFERLLHLH